MSYQDPLPPPPPAPYQVTSDIPPDSSYHHSPAPNNNKNAGIAGGLLALLAGAFAYGKYALLLLAKAPFLLTALSAVISVAAYSTFGGWWVGLGLVVMILVHEMGHVIEIRRQGLTATAPIFTRSVRSFSHSFSVKP